MTSQERSYFWAGAEAGEEEETKTHKLHTSTPCQGGSILDCAKLFHILQHALPYSLHVHKHLAPNPSQPN